MTIESSEFLVLRILLVKKIFVRLKSKSGIMDIDWRKFGFKRVKNNCFDGTKQFGNYTSFFKCLLFITKRELIDN